MSAREKVNHRGGRAQGRRAGVDPPESRRMCVGGSAVTTQPRGPRGWSRDSSSRCVSLGTELVLGLARGEGAKLRKRNLRAAEDSRS